MAAQATVEGVEDKVGGKGDLFKIAVVEPAAVQLLGKVGEGVDPFPPAGGARDPLDTHALHHRLDDTLHDVDRGEPRLGGSALFPRAVAARTGAPLGAPAARRRGDRAVAPTASQPGPIFAFDARPFVHATPFRTRGGQVPLR
jgi:hypothetical protein